MGDWTGTVAELREQEKHQRAEAKAQALAQSAIRKQQRFARMSSRKIKVRMRTRLYNNLFNNRSIRKNIYGCTLAELRAWLASQFVPGMTWDNHASVWEIDHRRPLSSFDLTDPEQRRTANHYTNLQPLFKAANRAKAARWCPAA